MILRIGNMSGIKLLYVEWFIVMAIILLIAFMDKGESTNFYGIAETKEVVINSNIPVEIKKIYVVPGQEVMEGDTLVELTSPELIIKINETSHQLEKLKAQKTLNDSEKKSLISQLESQKASIISDINYRIQQLKSQHEINKELTSELKSISQDEDTVVKQKSYKNPLMIKIESLKKEREHAVNLVQIKIDNLKTGDQTPEDAVAIQIQSLNEELKLLYEEKNKLIIIASINGIIGSVNFKAGEKISPFTPIVTLHTKAPSYVIGYIPENIYNKISNGEKVKIVSLTNMDAKTFGEVVGVGSRIVEYPLRLRKRPEVQMWGREVQVKIPYDNSFLLGEKVLISSEGMNNPTYQKKLKKLF